MEMAEEKPDVLVRPGDDENLTLRQRLLMKWPELDDYYGHHDRTSRIGGDVTAGPRFVDSSGRGSGSPDAI